MYTLESKIDDILKNPIGKDVFTMIFEQAKIPLFIGNNPLVKNLKLKHIVSLSKGNIDKDFMNMLCTVLNQPIDVASDDLLSPQTSSNTHKWWKEAIAYQIYPRSFKDSNNDGIGDLGGIVEKLDYLQELGINLLWLSPIYDSPNDDNGYDIRDYYKIMEEFGTMEDFDRLLEESHKRGIRLIMDLVINHTSDEHSWFQSAMTDENSPYHDYYIWKKSDGLPNNWESFFSGPAWNYYESIDKYALHLFSKKQMDLNWEHQPLRQELYKMIRYWLDKGIDGFRLDVINFISKAEGLPDGTHLVGTLMGQAGAEHYFFGPRLHEYLHEMHTETFAHYDTVTVGETPGVGINMSQLLTRPDRGELDLVFNFDHLDMAGKTKLDDYIYDLNYLKKVYIKWQTKFSTPCWNTLFYDNHDNPRMLSKVDPSGNYREPLSKLLAMIQLTLKGTPFIYQGQELGLTDGCFQTIDEFRDIESINLYKKLMDEGLGEKDTLKRVITGSRDHARLPMPWNNHDYQGFSKVEPWIYTQRIINHVTVASEMSEADSVFNFYRHMISLRKEEKDLIHGNIDFVAPNRKDYFAYFRTGQKRFFIEMNLSNKKVSSMALRSMKLILSNYSNTESDLNPYEARLYHVRWRD